MNSRRNLLSRLLRTTLAAAALPAMASAQVEDPVASCLNSDTEHSLDGEWLFRLDPDGTGEAQRWHQPGTANTGWHTITVPHTWQVTPASEEYRGTAWYRRTLDAPADWARGAVRIEFEAVFHSATVWINGQLAGQHLRKGYTSFVLDITRWVRFGDSNHVIVKVDNAFDDAMLPRGRSSDWEHDGGLYRSVRLLVTGPVFFEHLAVSATPRFQSETATQADQAVLQFAMTVQSTALRTWHGQLGLRVQELDSGRIVLDLERLADIQMRPGERQRLTPAAQVLAHPRLWHFDHPHLYTATVTLTERGQPAHKLATTFGIRAIEVRQAAFYLNGERVRLMGVERMAGSNPEFGMAESSSWIAHDLDDLKHLNCVLTRAHWPQDRRVLDYCDRHGILMQCEVPAWGYETFGDDAHPTADIMQNGLDQLREMIERDRNHPCIFSWGLCNEVGGQNPAAYEFAQRLYTEAKRLDPARLCSYASNSLDAHPERDVSGIMDFIECNEYFETWTAGTPADLRRSLLAIHSAFPDKPIVVSEFGYCGCLPERPERDSRRIEILVDHTQIMRELDFVAGSIFFCYNDYRTHVGLTGTGALRQRMHGVVDLYGQRKPSYAVLRRESSPVERLLVSGQPLPTMLTLSARQTIPAHRLVGYTLRGLLYGEGDIPIERHQVAIPSLVPGQQVTLSMAFAEQHATKIIFDVMRPDGCSTLTQIWRP